MAHTRVPVERVILRDDKVQNVKPRRLQWAREMKGFTRKEWVLLLRQNGVEVSLFAYRQIETGSVKPTMHLIEVAAKLSGMLPQWFVMRSGLDEEQLERAFATSTLNLHSRIVICDVCEAETGEDDVRARRKCDACKLDICEAHTFTYETDVPLPHGAQAHLIAAYYCPACYRRYIIQPKANATRAANRDKPRQMQMPHAAAVARKREGA